MADTKVSALTEGTYPLAATDYVYAAQGSPGVKLNPRKLWSPLITTVDASGLTNVDFTSLPSDFQLFRLVIDGLYPVTNGADIRLRVGTGGGPTYDTGNNYEWMTNMRDSGGGTAGTGQGSAVAFSAIFLAANNSINYRCNGELLFKGLLATDRRKNWSGVCEFVDSTPHFNGGYVIGDWLTTGTAVSALRIYESNGAGFSGGKVRLYGVPST